MTKKDFIQMLEHIAETGSNEIRLGELFDQVVAGSSSPSARDKVIDECILALRDYTWFNTLGEYAGPDMRRVLNKLKSSPPSKTKEA